MKPWIRRRCDLYNEAFKKWPASHIWYAGGFIRGVWMIGNNYKGSGYYGAYPPTYLERIFSMFPDAKNVLHLFSGSLKQEELNKSFPQFSHSLIDIRPDASDFGAICCDAQNASQHFPADYFDLALTDPPYSIDDAMRYKSIMINRAKTMRNLWPVIRELGWVVWMDQVKPMYRKDMWHLTGTIAIDRSTNHRVRMVYLSRRVEQ